ncbi:MAG: hypothetical protein QW567_02860 [Candidatus Hadarchaeales archaeon]
MPQRRYRTGRYRKRSVRAVKGTRTLYGEKTSRPASCASCGRPLAGVPRGKGARKAPRSSRRPNRPFGGYLCHACARNEIALRARA